MPPSCTRDTTGRTHRGSRARTERRSSTFPASVRRTETTRFREVMGGHSGTSAAGEADPSPHVRGARCATCRQDTPSHDIPHLPFCALPCSLLDQVVWL